jgi:hypothetical protein
MVSMKRITFIITLIFVVLLSSCHAQKFTYGSSQINLVTELDNVLELMMKKGNYNDDLLVPYSRTSLAIDYSKGNVVIEAVQFQVYRKSSNGEYQYDATGCFDVNGELKCSESRGPYTSENKIEEVLLTESFEIFKTVDVHSVIAFLKQSYIVVDRENTLLQYHLAYEKDIEEKVERFENIVFYYDDEYHFDNTYRPKDMVLEIRVDIFGSGSGETYILYYEIDQ